MKRLPILVFMIILLQITTITVCFANNILDIYYDGTTFTIKVDGNEIKTKGDYGSPFIDSSGRMQTPIRLVGEYLGAQVDWYNDTKTARISKGGKVTEFIIGLEVYYINGESHLMDTSPIMRNGRTYIPLSYVAEALGYSINFNFDFSDDSSPSDENEDNQDQQTENSTDNSSTENSNSDQGNKDNSQSTSDNNSSDNNSSDINNSNNNGNSGSDSNSNESDNGSDSDNGSPTDSSGNSNSDANVNNDNNPDNEQTNENSLDNSEGVGGAGSNNSPGGSGSSSGSDSGGISQNDNKTLYEQMKDDLQLWNQDQEEINRKMKAAEEKVNGLMELLRPVILFAYGILFLTSVLTFIILFVRMAYLPHFPTQRRRAIEDMLQCVVVTIISGGIFTFVGLYWGMFGDMVNSYLQYSQSWDDAFNPILSSYKEFVSGVFGLGCLTLFVLFVKNFVQLGTSASHPENRKEAMTGLLMTGLSTAGLGSITVWLAIFWNLL